MNIGYTDGANFCNEMIGNNIGYTDGLPFVSQANNIYEPFKSYTKKVSNFSSAEKICGVSYGYFANRGEIRSPLGRQSQKLMYELNNNWVCLPITAYQKNFYSTQIYSDFVRTVSDRDIEDFVKNAHSKGVKVCLKPMVHSEDNVWRAHIGFPDLNMSDLDVYWKEWFISYKHFILHYAELAQELGVEMFCAGCEMMGTEHREWDWRYVIKEVRRVYSGKIVYSSNHDGEIPVWTDDLDYIGLSAYYPVGTGNYNLMKENWDKIREKLDKISKEKGRQYIFMEVGCRSVNEAGKHPWDFTLDLPWSEQEQKNYYEALFNIFGPDDCFAGLMIWDWPTFQYQDRTIAAQDKDFNVHLKAAENVIKNYYTKVKNNG